MLQILLLEDEQSIADTIIYAFETDGFTVQHEVTCFAAEGALRCGNFDLAIFDVGLPDGTGFELCKKVRGFSDLPLLFLTARSEEIDRVVGLEIGADDYVTKPFSPRELVARVKAILRRSRVLQAQSAEIAPSKGLQWDEMRYVFTYGGETLSLTRAESQLLLTLFKQPERVFTRDQLLDKMNPDYGAALDRVIDAHIKAIRAKLRAVTPNGALLISTKRGLGYAYNPE